MKIEVQSAADPAGEVRRVPFDASLGGEPLPRRVLVAPWGEVRSSNGTFLLDEQAARLTLAAFAAQGADLPIDYEHQSLGGPYASPTGQAPAAGWIKALQALSPADAQAASNGAIAGLWAEVEWTPQAAAQLLSRQYRYLSPVALVRRGDGRMVGLHSAALTNKPAIAGMQPVVNRQSPHEARAELCGLLDLDAEADDETVLVAAAQRVRGLQSRIEARRAADCVAAASAAGKLAPVQRDWAYALALRDPAGFDAWFAAAPVVVSVGRTRGPAEPRGAPDEAVRRRAREEYRSGGTLLAAICSEEAFVRDALRARCDRPETDGV